MSLCVGVKKDGVRCNVMVVGEGQHLRCGTHKKTLEKVGPNQVRRDEMKYIHARMTNEIFTRFRVIMNGVQGAEFERQMRARSAAIREEEIRYRLDLNTLEETINRETEENAGVNADHAFIVRNRAAQQARRAALQERWRLRNELWQQRHAAQVAHHHAAPAVGGGELAQLANDRQNVHTAVVVQKVKETVQKVLQIPVPPEYQTETLKTSGEIILECSLTKQSAWQMMAKYCGDEDIYELGRGIYARVLNSVWQYIKTSPDAADLKKILASEMTDNIGMCAQGNLSRLCNILSGYLEGVNVDTRSKNEIIGERIAKLVDIEHAGVRVAAARRVLVEHDVPEEEHNIWLDPLIEA
jgi:arsenate reductase-like glutaredoxin family protein